MNTENFSTISNADIFFCSFPSARYSNSEVCKFVSYAFNNTFARDLNCPIFINLFGRFFYSMYFRSLSSVGFYNNMFLIDLNINIDFSFFPTGHLAFFSEFNSLSLNLEYVNSLDYSVLCEILSSYINSIPDDASDLIDESLYEMLSFVCQFRHKFM